MDALERMAKETKTQYWIDTCDEAAIEYAIARGAVGATSNPVIVKTVLEDNLNKYKPLIQDYIKAHPTADEDSIAWHVIAILAQNGAKLFMKIFNPSQGVGRLSIQTNPKFYNNTEAIIQQSREFAKLAPNMQIKIPATQSGIAAMEEVTYEGMSINATVSFTVSQALAVAEAVERGLERRKKEGKSISDINPVCTIMVGRVDDWITEQIKQTLRQAHFFHSCVGQMGVAVFKHAYELYQKKSYRTKLLAAAYRNYHQWLEFVGGDVIETIPLKWQKIFNQWPHALKNRIDIKKDADVLDYWLTWAPDFAKMYQEGALKVSEFDQFGATKATLHQFMEGYSQLLGIIRHIMLPK